MGVAIRYKSAEDLPTFEGLKSGEALAVREVKKRARPRHLEDDLQRDCVKWFRLQYRHRVIIAIPNGGRRNAREAQRLKEQGVLAGVPDLFIPEPMISKGTSGLWIELKVGKNTQSPAQKSFMMAMASRNYAAQEARTFDQFQQIVRWYLGAS